MLPSCPASPGPGTALVWGCCRSSGPFQQHGPRGRGRLKVLSDQLLPHDVAPRRRPQDSWGSHSARVLRDDEMMSSSPWTELQSPDLGPTQTLWNVHKCLRPFCGGGIFIYVCKYMSICAHAQWVLVPKYGNSLGSQRSSDSGNLFNYFE